ncbi:hypothetical protein ACFQZE_04935 [Paenibacillus sp. GCM10027627]|uniref:hypothetical protein n=1 Tax=unclassified Paenibacillus TaxID=185978 RepID=UPI00362D7F37
MEIIDRYIYAVTQRLPGSHRADIKQELKGLIEDMLEDRAPAGMATENDAKSVLTELGHPNVLAAKYNGHRERYFIGPSLIEPYFTTLKVVLISIGIALSALFAFEVIVTGSSVTELVTEYLVTLVNTAAQGFGLVTVVFAWIEHRNRKNAAGNFDPHKDWKPADLPTIPDQLTRIKLSEPISGIIFTVLFMAVCLYSIELLGVWRIHEGERILISYLNVEAFQVYLPLVWGIAVLAILKESVRMIVRSRTGKLLVLHIAVTAAATAIMCIVMSDSAIWNANFLPQMEAAGLLSAGSEHYENVASIWSRVGEWLVALTALYGVIDILTESYKWFKIKRLA